MFAPFSGDCELIFPYTKCESAKRSARQAAVSQMQANSCETSPDVPVNENFFLA